MNTPTRTPTATTTTLWITSATTQTVASIPTPPQIAAATLRRQVAPWTTAVSGAALEAGCIAVPLSWILVRMQTTSVVRVPVLGTAAVAASATMGDTARPGSVEVRMAGRQHHAARHLGRILGRRCRATGLGEAGAVGSKQGARTPGSTKLTQMNSPIVETRWAGTTWVHPGRGVDILGGAGGRRLGHGKGIREVSMIALSDGSRSG